MSELTLEEIKKLPPKARVEKLKEFDVQQKKKREDEEKRLKAEEEEIIKKSIEEITKEEQAEEEEEKLVIQKERTKSKEESLEQIAEKERTPQRTERNNEYFIAQEYQMNASRRPPTEIYGRAKEIWEMKEERGYLPQQMQQEANNLAGAFYIQEKKGYFDNREANVFKSKMEQIFEQIANPISRNN